MIDEDDPSYVSALARGLQVIRAFDAEHGALTLAEIAKLTGLPRATVRRSLLTLEALGYVVTSGKYFNLTPRILALGYAYLASTPLTRVLQPALERVSETIGESCSASTLDGSEIVYVARTATRRIMSVGLGVGSRLPAFCTSMGRVLLAALPPDRARALLGTAPLPRLTARTVTDRDALMALLAEVARDGYAMVDEELEIGLRSIAVPVRSASGQVLAAMNVGVQAGRIGPHELLARVLPVLQEASASLTLSLVN